MTVLIKRYANRKLYNTQTSRYITLKGIAELLDSHEDVRVIDNETGEDITSVTLSQILVDTERANRSMPRSVLSDLIQRGGDALYGALRRGVDDATDGIGDLQRNVRKLIRHGEHGEAGEWRAFSRGDLEKMLQGALERVFRLLDLPRRSDVDALNRNLERVADALDKLDAAPRAASTSQASARREAPPASAPD